MTATFDACVALLEWAAPHLALTYKELNVWLFVILHPALTLALLGRCWWLARRHRRTTRETC